MACDYSIYVGYTVAQIQELLDEALLTLRKTSSGKLVQRVATGDTSVAFANNTLSIADLQKTITALRAALAAAQAASDGRVPMPPPARAIFPWPC